MARHSWSARRRAVLIWSVLTATILVSHGGSFVLSLNVTGLDAALLLGSLPVVLAIKLGAFVLFGVHRGMWRYSGADDLLSTWFAALVGGTALLAAALLVRLPGWNPSVIIIDSLLTVSLLTAVRMGPRLLRECCSKSKKGRRVVIIGGGDAGEAVVRELRRGGTCGLWPTAIVDDDTSKLDQEIHGVRVVGRLDDLSRVIQETRAEALVVAICGLPTERARFIRAVARSAGIPVKRIPSLKELMDGSAGIAELRDFTLEELLSRKPIRTDRAPVASLLQGRTVLVTGAAGSIGSELCRQIVRMQPSKLLLLDNNENALFSIDGEMRAIETSTECTPILCNIRDFAKLDAMFGEHEPDVVFHAAAYKHVPVLESFPEEAVRNNIHGTRNLARLADTHGVESFVLISTDKAVRPTSVMGTTKRVAELLVGEIDRRSDTQFTTIRFGNVLGSNGSVMQIFRQQVAAGGPVTVTHPEMRRFFMSIPEAVELVLFAASVDDRGSTFVLDMGEQVRIVDIARHFIRLCGLEPDRDIEVKFTGLRPGEKLYEELWTEREVPIATEHEGILRAPRAVEPLFDLDRAIDVLVDWAEEGDQFQGIQHLRALVPDYSGEPLCPARPIATSRAAARLIKSVSEKNLQEVELQLIEGVGSDETRKGQMAVPAR